jgi:hypothetical protein
MWMDIQKKGKNPATIFCYDRKPVKVKFWYEKSILRLLENTLRFMEIDRT